MKRIFVIAAFTFCTVANADVSMGELANMAYADAMRGGNLTDAQHVVYRYRVEIGRMVDEKKMPLESAIELLQRMEGKPLATVSQGEVLRQQAERENQLQQQRLAAEQAERNRLWLQSLQILSQGAANKAQIYRQQQPLPLSSPVYCSSFKYGPNQTSTTCY